MIFVLLSGAALPAAAWLTMTVIALRNSQPDSPARPRYLILFVLLSVLGIASAVQFDKIMNSYGLSDALQFYWITGVFGGFPLAALSLFIGAVVRFNRCPDVPSMLAKRKILAVIAGIVLGISIALPITILIVGAINLSKM